MTGDAVFLLRSSFITAYFLLSRTASANPLEQRTTLARSINLSCVLLASVLPTLDIDVPVFLAVFLALFTLNRAAGTARLEFLHIKALYERLRQQYNAHETPPTPGSTVCVDAVAAAA